MRAYDPRRVLGYENLTPKALKSRPARIATWLAVGVTLFVYICIRSRYGPGLWPPAQRLLVFPGAVALIFGIWQVVASRSGAVEPATLSSRQQGWAGVAMSLGVIGFGLDYDYPGGPWLGLWAPLGLLFVVMAFWLPRQPATDSSEPLPPVLAVLVGVFGLIIVALAATDFV